LSNLVNKASGPFTEWAKSELKLTIKTVNRSKDVWWNDHELG
jgi:hypothetical protein